MTRVLRPGSFRSRRFRPGRPRFGRPAGRLAAPGIALALASIAPAAAHDLWIEPDGDATVLRMGHRHSGHAGADLVDYPAVWVLAARAFDAAGRALDWSPPPGTTPVRFPAGAAATWARVSSGTWTKTPQGSVNLPPADVEHALDSWVSIETVARLDAWSDALAAPLGDGLAIVPTADPRGLSPGDKLTVRVLRDGVPVAGVPVAVDGETRGATRADGTVRLKARATGPNVLAATLRAPSPGPGEPRRIETAVLVLDVGGSR